MSASVTVDLPAGLPAVVLVDGSPARPGEAVPVAAGRRALELQFVLDVTGGELRGASSLPIDVPVAGSVRVTPPGLYWLKISAV